MNDLDLMYFLDEEGYEPSIENLIILKEYITEQFILENSSRRKLERYKDANKKYENRGGNYHLYLRNEIAAKYAGQRAGELIARARGALKREHPYSASRFGAAAQNAKNIGATSSNNADGALRDQLENK